MSRRLPSSLPAVLYAVRGLAAASFQVGRQQRGAECAYSTHHGHLQHLPRLVRGAARLLVPRGRALRRVGSPVPHPRCAADGGA
eukprot:14132004-Alexandrium_andersonii.AAC.1